jgi:hypothetical protein
MVVRPYRWTGRPRRTRRRVAKQTRPTVQSHLTRMRLSSSPSVSKSRWSSRSSRSIGRHPAGPRQPPPSPSDRDIGLWREYRSKGPSRNLAINTDRAIDGQISLRFVIVPGSGADEPAVSRILCRSLSRRGGDHPSTPAVADRLQRPTRRLGRAALERLRRDPRGIPSWPCSGWGLPCRPGHPGRGGLLHAPFHPYPACDEAVCSLWHCPASHLGLPLATTLPSGVRTFLGPDAWPGTRPPCRLVRSHIVPVPTDTPRRRPDHDPVAPVVHTQAVVHRSGNRAITPGQPR